MLNIFVLAYRKCWHICRRASGTQMLHCKNCRFPGKCSISVKRSAYARQCSAWQNATHGSVGSVGICWHICNGRQNVRRLLRWEGVYSAFLQTDIHGMVYVMKWFTLRLLTFIIDKRSFSGSCTFALESDYF